MRRINKMKMITRTIQTHVIHVAEIMMDGDKINAEPIGTVEISNQSINNSKALKLAQKKFGKDKQLAISSIETKEVKYGVDFDTFMEHAVVLNEDGGAE